MTRPPLTDRDDACDARVKPPSQIFVAASAVRTIAPQPHPGSLPKIESGAARIGTVKRREPATLAGSG